METDNNNSENNIGGFDLSQGIPGTAQIRKIGALLSPMELLELSARMAREGLDKKLWSVLSRVFEDKKGFGRTYDKAMDQYVNDILSSEVPAELKLQTFTSFLLPECLLPDAQVVRKLVTQCDEKRKNIAAYFIADYDLWKDLYDVIIGDQEILGIVIGRLSMKGLMGFFELIFTRENKECITGAIRLAGKNRKKFEYADVADIQRLTDIAFESKEVFFTSKLLFCMTFKVPESVVKSERTLDRILKISINYEERTTKDFVEHYNLRFDCSDLAICKYYLGNKKSTNQKGLVYKFAGHLCRLDNENDKRYLLRGAFKRGGYFRMYAGCMQDGFIDPEKMKKYHYSNEDVAWCSNLPGLKK